MDKELERKIDECRNEFEAETGRPFEHFYCPILLCDEAAEMCKGHVVPKAFGSCNAWVPQRADVDNFYGSAVESHFVGVVEDRGKNPFEVWLNPKLRRRHRPRIEYKGKSIEHYFPRSLNDVAGQTPVQLATDEGTNLCDLVVKMSSEEMMALDGEKIQLVIERDYRPPVLASLLKAAHLTLFKMLGYRHVVSPTGTYLADILRQFYTAHKESPRNELDEAIEEYFGPLSCMVSPMIMRNESVFQGTATDNRILACIGASQGMFAIGVIVKAGSDAFCVFVPTDDGRTIDTYFSFLKQPPESIAAKLIQYFPNDEEKGPHWASSKEEPMRIPLPHSLPETIPDWVK